MNGMELGKTIGLDIHECNIARLELSEESINYYGINTRKLEGKELYGALCTSFLIEEKESLIEGADMIMEIDPSYDRKTLRGETEVYSYDLLERLFLQYGELEYLNRMGYIPKPFNAFFYKVLKDGFDIHARILAKIPEENRPLILVACKMDEDSFEKLKELHYMFEIRDWI